MIRRAVLILLTAVVAMGAGVAPADASDKRPCVTRQEYRDVRSGWPQARMSRHFDTRGARINSLRMGDGLVYSFWKYRKCSAWGPGGWYVGVAYTNALPRFSDNYMRVFAKAPNRPRRLLDLIE
jgi:hypothetical protein